MSELSDLINAIADLDEPYALKLLLKHLEKGNSVYDILEECRNGMVVVGERYANGKYFLGDLVLSAEIFQQLVRHLDPMLNKKNYQCNNKIVFGTVAGDIHDIGKNIAISLMQCHGFKVYDLGISVSAESFIESLKENEASILCLSILLSSCIEDLKRTIDMVKQVGSLQNVKVLIGGSVNEMICNYVKADSWTNDARQGVTICQQWSAPE